MESRFRAQRFAHKVGPFRGIAACVGIDVAGARRAAEPQDYRADVHPWQSILTDISSSDTLTGSRS